MVGGSSRVPRTPGTARVVYASDVPRLVAHLLSEQCSGLRNRTLDPPQEEWQFVRYLGTSASTGARMVFLFSLICV